MSAKMFMIRSKADYKYSISGQDTAKDGMTQENCCYTLTFAWISALGREAQFMLVPTSILQSWPKVSFEGSLRRLYCARVSRCISRHSSSNRIFSVRLAKSLSLFET